MRTLTVLGLVKFQKEYSYFYLPHGHYTYIVFIKSLLYDDLMFCCGTLVDLFFVTF